MKKKGILTFIMAAGFIALAAVILYLVTSDISMSFDQAAGSDNAAGSISTTTAGTAAKLTVPEYETTLFAQDTVHTLDIRITDDNWRALQENAAGKEYVPCDIVLDGTAFYSVGLRTKGNSSLSETLSLGSERYSFKLEFDHYKKGASCFGLDKLSLNNIIQDNTYMKDFLSYTLMNQMGAYAPLCSYIFITVNGEDFGLYLAVEGIEDSYLDRTFCSDTGSLYKPESTQNNAMVENMMQQAEGNIAQNGELPFITDYPFIEDAPEHDEVAIQEDGFDLSSSSDADIALQYIDDEIVSYPDIFEQAVTDVDEADEMRLIAAVKKLNAGENLDEVLNTNEILRYFVVHNFVDNFDSYTGPMLHNYYLYEDQGQLSIIAWDYNLAFGGFNIEMPSISSDLAATRNNAASMFINYPMDTPVSGTTMEDRPLLEELLSDDTYLLLYHALFDTFLSTYLESGYVTDLIQETKDLILPFVERDPTSFCSKEDFLLGVSTLSDFCELRAQSLRGQLDGIIPSTSLGQENCDTLIDASSIDLSALGGAKLRDEQNKLPPE